MMYWHGDWSWAAWLAMMLTMLVFWGAVIGIVLVAIRALTQRSPGPGRADEVLAERFARGEIDEPEYRSRLAALHDARTGGAEQRS